ncbi:hypothetical protein MUO69_01315 [Candidatus Bathyarchaeota archaeon]|nr:hypothetical protein [Candidatus Bathyarchaeota archaeon]
MLSDDLLIITFVTVGAIITCAAVVYVFVTRRRKRRKVLELKKTETAFTGLPFKMGKSVSSDDAQRAKGELRTLDLEREILSDAIRRLYEAHAEGKITEEERERLAQTYKSRMMTVKDAISKDESVVALHELEAMQEDLMKLFSDRFDEISGKIEELRTKAETRSIKEIAIQPQDNQATTKPEEKAKKRKTPPKPSPKTDAEKRIEEIRNEVEKVLDRLGQMEIES